MAKTINIQLKPEFANTKVAFNGSGKPLGQRKDLHHLLLSARRGNDKHILSMFINPPKLEELQTAVTDEELESTVTIGSAQVVTTPATTEGDKGKNK